MSAACPVFGFFVELEVGPRDDAIKVMATLVDEVLDPRGLVVEAGAGHGASFVVRGEAAQATNADADAVVQWANGRSEILGARIGPLVDLTEG